MHDKFRKRYKVPEAGQRVRHQIALEAARRLVGAARPDEDAPPGDVTWLAGLSEAEIYTAKRKAAAVLGHRVRPGDLPSDGEVREQAVVLIRSRAEMPAGTDPDYPEPDDDVAPAALADHLDRFAVYRLRLAPLESVKQNPKYHPEGDALYHSLQVFERAREVRPYDEEFLLAALLHDVGKAIDPPEHAAVGAEALRGAVTERTRWLIEHHMDLMPRSDRKLGTRARAALEASGYIEDLRLLRELDDAGRMPGVPVGTIDQALAYLKGLEAESFLEEQ